MRCLNLFFHLNKTLKGLGLYYQKIHYCKTFPIKNLFVSLSNKTYAYPNKEISILQVASLMLETMMLIGYSAILHVENQALLRWGKHPTILQKVGICEIFNDY